MRSKQHRYQTFSFMRGLKPSARQKSQAFFAGFILAGSLSGAAVAQESIPNTYTDVSVPQLTGWNQVNAYTVDDTVDGFSGATAKTYIYTDEAAKADVAAGLVPWETNSPAQVYWELDNGSGRAPGIQTVTDDFDFPTNNCIMASGEIFNKELNAVVPKTCSDGEGSSKRYFLEIVEADVPVDMVFDVGMKDIRYKGLKSDDGGEELNAFREEFGIGRIYRVIQKVINNSDERWLGIELELGHGVGDEFIPFDFATDGVAFELRNEVPREFFEGETGAPAISVWNPERFSTFSPKAFDDGARDRFDPGFFSNQAAGLFPPQDVGTDPEKTTRIFSGGDFSGRITAYGAITPNFFSMAESEDAALGTSFSAQGIFGYMLSDSLAPFTIARYNEGIPGGESDALEAWWDGSNWRYGQAGGEEEGVGSVAPFGIVGDDQLEAWAEKLLGTPTTADDKVRYDSILADDLATQNMDVFIYIGDGILDESGHPKYENITLRVTGISTRARGLEGSRGNNIPAWVDGGAGSKAPLLVTYRAPRPNPEALDDSATAIGVFPVEVNLLKNDLLNKALLSQRIANGDVSAVFAVDTNPVNGSVSIDGDGVATYTADEGFTGQDTFTYKVTVTDSKVDDDDYDTNPVSNIATVTIDVVSYPGADAPTAENDSAVTFINSAVTIDVLDNDNLPMGTATVSVPASKDAGGPVFGTVTVADNKVVYTPAQNLTFDDEPTKVDRFIYTVEVNGKKSAALITVRIDDLSVEESPETDSNKGGGTLFGCSYNPGSPFDPTLPLVVLAAMGGLVIRNRRKQTLH
ncbi:choice-of-anchor F family protein [Marinobacter sp.]|uniref:choice-of-anchor F family protein n=1 Tax=Marinobacter sp. TaxID=50741 RepID=UPI003568BF57